MDLDINFVRSQFPAFSENSLMNKAFFENAGGSYACEQVINRLNRFYIEKKVQPYGAFEASISGGNEMDEARVGLARYLGVKEHEVSFGPSTSQNTYVLTQAFGEWLVPGNAIIVTNQDHEANTGAWRRLSNRGVLVKEWKVNKETGELNLEDLVNLLDDDVKLVCFPHCSNIVAHINPVKEIISLVHSAGAYVCVDGVSYAPHGLPNINEIGADIYLFSSYKTYGPHQGIMVIKEVLAELLPNQGHYFNEKFLTKKFTPAGPDHAQIAACAGIVEYFDALASHHGLALSDAPSGVHKLFRNYEQKILQPLLDYVDAKNSIRLLGPSDASKRAPTVALDLGVNSFEVAKKLSELNVLAGGDDFYAVRLLEALGVDMDHGALRLSFVHYTKEEEVKAVIQALDEVL
jgi:selenocysteine lyase/cysteine desulfurase